MVFFCDFCGARATLCGNRRGRGAKTQGFCDFCCSNWSSGVVSWFARLLPEPAGRGFDSSVARRNLHFTATCAEQVAQSNLRRPTCTDQFAQSALPGAFPDRCACVKAPNHCTVASARMACESRTVAKPAKRTLTEALASAA